MGNAEYMGSLAKSSSLQTFKMMKSIAVVALCLFAAAAGEAEASADASAYYGHHGYGYGHGLGGYYGHGYGHGYGHAVGYAHHGYGHGYYGKRSADAEPTAAAEPAADAYYGYGHALGYSHHGYRHALGYAHHGYTGYPYAHHKALGSDKQNDKNNKKRPKKEKSPSERIFLDFKNAEGPVVGKNRHTRKEKEPFSNLPTMPVSEKLPRKKETENKENKQTKRGEKNGLDKNNKNKSKEGKSIKQKESKSISEKIVEKKESKTISEDTVEKELEAVPEIKNVELEGKKDLRKILEEKSKKYSHLPVYDKEAEKRKAKERQAKMSGIFSDMDKQLESVTDLTSSHMAKKGITMKTSATPFDEPSEDSEPSIEAHTIRYNKGILNPRHSASQTQGISEKDRTSIMSVSKTVTALDNRAKPAPIKEQITEKVIFSVTPDSKYETGTEVSEEATVSSEPGINVSKTPVVTAEPVYALPPYKRNLVTPILPVKNLSEKSEGATYESLGHTFRELTEKMQTVTKDIKSEPET